MSHVLKFIEEGEHQRQDFKLRIDSSRKIANTIVAFANSQGGRILIGVKDNGKVTGVNIEEELHMIEGAVQLYCKPTIEYKTQVWKSDFKQILEVIVLASDKRPHYAESEENKWEAYVRVKDKIRKVNGVQQKVWVNQNTNTEANFEYDQLKEKLFNYLRQKGKISFFNVSKITRISFKEAEDLLSNLIIWGILEMHYDNNGCYYTLAPDK